MKLNADMLSKLPLALRIQIEENAQRKPLTQSELAAEQQAILGVLRKYKAPGQRTDLSGGGATSENTFSEVRATAIVGKLYGESHKQVKKRRDIVDAAAAEPERYNNLREDMDRTGRVNGVHRRLKIAKQAEVIRAEAPPLPDKGRTALLPATSPGPTKSALPTPRSAARCRIPPPRSRKYASSRWHRSPHRIASFGCGPRTITCERRSRCSTRGGFEQKTILTWVKDRFGTGDWLRGRTEHCLMAVRGKPIVTLTNESTVLSASVRGHSAKPREFYDFVEKLCPAPRYADLFSRYRHNDKWDLHGDEAPRASGRSVGPRGEELDVRIARSQLLEQLDIEADES